MDEFTEYSELLLHMHVAKGEVRSIILLGKIESPPHANEASRSMAQLILLAFLYIRHSS